MAGSVYAFAATSRRTQPFHQIGEATALRERTDDAIAVMRAASQMILLSKAARTSSGPLS